MSKRLEMLQKLTSSGNVDSFTWYALALEYKGLGRIDEALQAFLTLREKDPNYVPAYLMAGTMLASAGRLDEAQDWLKTGIEIAQVKGDPHASSEMELALEGINP